MFAILVAILIASAIARTTIPNGFGGRVGGFSIGLCSSVALFNLLGAMVRYDQSIVRIERRERRRRQVRRQVPG